MNNIIEIKDLITKVSGAKKKDVINIEGQNYNAQKINTFLKLLKPIKLNDIILINIVEKDLTIDYTLGNAKAKGQVKFYSLGEA